MIRQLALSSLQDSELIPQAILGRPPSYFSDVFGYRFIEDVDDLDAFEGAAFILDDCQPFALMHYQGHPADSTTIYLPSDVDQLGEVADVLRQILADLGLPDSAVLWDRPSHGFSPPVLPDPEADHSKIRTEDVTRRRRHA